MNTYIMIITLIIQPYVVVLHITNNKEAWFYCAYIDVHVWHAYVHIAYHQGDGHQEPVDSLVDVLYEHMTGCYEHDQCKQCPCQLYRREINIYIHINIYTDINTHYIHT